MTYDDRGIMLTKTEAKGTLAGEDNTYAYHPTFNKIQTRTEASIDNVGQNKITTYTYDDANGNLLRETVTGYSGGIPFIYTTSYQYNTQGQLTQTDGPRTDVDDITIYTYHQTYGYLTSITYPNGTVTYDNFDANHNIGSITDQNGVITPGYILQGGHELPTRKRSDD